MSDDEHELHRLLGEIVANQRAMFAEQKRVNDLLKQHFEDDTREFNDVRKRLVHIESKISYAAGAIAVLATGVALFWGTILDLFRGGA